MRTRHSASVSDASGSEWGSADSRPLKPAAAQATRRLQDAADVDDREQPSHDEEQATQSARAALQRDRSASHSARAGIRSKKCHARNGLKARKGKGEKNGARECDHRAR